MGENNVEAVTMKIGSIDARGAGAQMTLEMVYYLVMNIGVVNDGALIFIGFSSCQCIVCCPSDGKFSMDDVHQTLVMFKSIRRSRD